MSHRRIGAMALVLGAAAGVFGGAALITSPMAYATDPPPEPPFFDAVPPGVMGDRTVIEDASIPFLYNFLEQNVPYTIYDQTDQVVGTYDARETSELLGLLPVLGISNSSAVVTDSTGAAPAVGTEYDGTAIFSVVALGGSNPQELIGNSVMNSPDGTLSDLFTIGALGNYFSTGPTGILDEVGFFTTWVPIIDIPA